MKFNNDFLYKHFKDCVKTYEFQNQFPKSTEYYTFVSRGVIFQLRNVGVNRSPFNL